MKEQPVKTFGIRKYINEETLGGLVLIAATIAALIWANSAAYPQYHHLWHKLKAGLHWGSFKMDYSLHHWINDGLMAVFFFTVGLEIKREVIGGELSSVKKAIMPVMAALGGMIVPALFYTVMLWSHPEFAKGWGIPMATDIAFALGLLAMLGKRVPLNLKIFLTALAIADDLGAVLVIAIFYTESINYNELITAAVFLAILLGANYAGVRRTLFYALTGLIGVWTSFMFSGVHATIAGVLLALTIPARTKIDEKKYITKLKLLTGKFKESAPNENRLLTSQQAHILDEIETLNEKAHTPLQKLEHALHPVNAYFILPLFALANAGVHIEGNLFRLIIHPVSLGIIAGLLLGKFAGISLMSRLVARFKWADLPEGVTWKQIYGAGMLAGIGFTMSIFISELAFSDPFVIQVAKVGIMTASLIAAVVGMVWIAGVTKK